MFGYGCVCEPIPKRNTEHIYDVYYNSLFKIITPSIPVLSRWNRNSERNPGRRSAVADLLRGASKEFRIESSNKNYPIEESVHFIYWDFPELLV